MKKVVRLNEWQLRKIIKSTIKKAINESTIGKEGFGDTYNAADAMEWPFESGNDVWEEIAKEGGMSWSDGNVEFKIVKEGNVYRVYGENGELIGHSMHLHKAQKGLYNAVVDYLEGQTDDTEEEEY